MMNTIDFEFLLKNLPDRPKDAHKGVMGSLCAVTGSFGFSGASVLCAKAALRTGVGLLFQILPESIYPIFASSVLEAVCVPVEDSPDGTVSKDATDVILSTVNRCSAAVIGCGLKNTHDTRAVVETLIKNAAVPLILDADGINAISKNPEILFAAQAEITLTPHPKEFSRLSGLSVEYIQNNREAVSKELSQHRSCAERSPHAYRKKRRPL